jgi:hypothetical protein
MVRNALIVAANTATSRRSTRRAGRSWTSIRWFDRRRRAAFRPAGGSAHRRRVERALRVERDGDVAAEIADVLDGPRFDGPRDTVL